MNPKPRLESAFQFITDEEDARVCKDIPDEACHDQPRNFFAYLMANLINKIADELTSAKLVLPWLLASLGAPVAFAGFLVPIREAGVLLPQLVVAAVIRQMAIRKTVWLLGAALSGLSLFIMALAAANLSGATAGWAIIALLIVFSLSRGLCSVSAKDVLGKTISKGKRGALMGYSAGLAGVVTLAFGFYIQQFSESSANLSIMITLLSISGVMWLISLLFFAAIVEQPGATSGGGNALTTALKSFSLLGSDKLFRQFVIARCMLLSVALAPPFYVLLAQQHTSAGVAGLGTLIIASGIANSISAPIWGRMGDNSSRKVMIIAALLAALLSILIFILVETESKLLSSPIIHALFFLTLTISHCGVRLGRKIYLVDMANTDTRASYVAVSNTVIGIAMLLAGSIGIIADMLEIHYLIFALGLVCLGASAYIRRLPEVSHR